MREGNEMKVTTISALALLVTISGPAEALDRATTGGAFYLQNECQTLGDALPNKIKIDGIVRSVETNYSSSENMCFVRLLVIATGIDPDKRGDCWLDKLYDGQMRRLIAYVSSGKDCGEPGLYDGEIIGAPYSSRSADGSVKRHLAADKFITEKMRRD
jgi:hypothetical protein